MSRSLRTEGSFFGGTHNYADKSQNIRRLRGFVCVSDRIFDRVLMESFKQSCNHNHQVVAGTSLPFPMRHRVQLHNAGIHKHAPPSCSK